MDLFVKLEHNKKFMAKYNAHKQKKLEKEKQKRVRSNYVFEDRQKGSENVCIILSGYKEYLWEDVFSRISKYSEDIDMDICIVSSGMYHEKLSELAKEKEWSYLSIERNNVALTQNIAIHLHKKAKRIFKLDEDMFLTENYFRQSLETLKRVEEDCEYKIGFVAPMIPINGYSHVDVLKKLNLLEDFENTFGKVCRDRGNNANIVKNVEVAKYLWGSTQKKLRNIDQISKELSEEEFSYSVCPIIFSIGAILFTRDLWEEMGRFKVTKGTSMGFDEVQICHHCMLESKAIIVSHNTLVGHFSYGPQTKEMIQYYNENREIFKLK